MDLAPPTQGDTSVTYTLGLACPQCGERHFGLLDNNVAGENTPSRTRALVICNTCTWEGRIEVRLTRTKLHDVRRHAPTGFLLVSCWCEQSTLYVRQADVLATDTASCGRPGCEPPAHLERTS